jgi:hypothetical protein
MVKHQSLSVCFTIDRIQHAKDNESHASVDYARFEQQPIHICTHIHPVTKGEPNTTCNHRFPSHSSDQDILYQTALKVQKAFTFMQPNST